MLSRQYTRASDAAEEQEAEDGDMNKVFFNHIGLSYRYYMAGNDDAIADLDDELLSKFGECLGFCGHGRGLCKERWYTHTDV